MDLPARFTTACKTFPRGASAVYTRAGRCVCAQNGMPRRRTRQVRAARVLRHKRVRSAAFSQHDFAALLAEVRNGRSKWQWRARVAKTPFSVREFNALLASVRARARGPVEFPVVPGGIGQVLGRGGRNVRLLQQLLHPGTLRVDVRDHLVVLQPPATQRDAWVDEARRLLCSAQAGGIVKWFPMAEVRQMGATRDQSWLAHIRDIEQRYDCRVRQLHVDDAEVRHEVWIVVGNYARSPVTAAVEVVGKWVHRRYAPAGRARVTQIVGRRSTGRGGAPRFGGGGAGRR